MKLESRYTHQKDLMVSVVEFRDEIQSVLETLDDSDDDGTLARQALKCLAASSEELAHSIEVFQALP
jgi:CHASE1-domain containing sensor protein